MGKQLSDCMILSRYECIQALFNIIVILSHEFVNCLSVQLLIESWIIGVDKDFTVSEL